ncbi:hypothetical protein Sipo8835_08070 [Streptomyces ipomoeae]|uniref:Uncharacterized protein n=1 Tax=Streptomyces ipomoeae TaxID=103232 RepID=A0AAE9B2D6_9ACTN|nr:hypothetical protein [Streptomyces ipomoeae]MDX2698293.1 hypothetical protein [Streptomyces ipomoeae]MDX2843953.1 hypothetical protein [Streptomyces ipomoeae]TQE37315.1 hypothetical protein Sipo8835_08070 [Streptomyces ipomoeae]
MTSSRSRVLVRAPDSRGLREVSVGAKTVGRAWSPRDLRRVLRRAGVPADIDLGRSGEVRWQADPDLWPDRPWWRRAQAGLMGLGLLVSAAVLFRVGLSDALRALTFGGRVMGVVFLVGALAETLAAAAVFDYWGKRATRYAGQCVLLGVAIVTVTSLMFLILQWEGGYHAGLFWLWCALVAWSAWALWEMSRQKVWQSIPHPRSFAAGVALSALIGAASVAYSAMYTPYVAPPKVPFMAAFGKPTLNAARTSLYVPARLTFRNEGSISIFVVGTQWSATLWPSSFREKGTGRARWRDELGNGWNTYRHEDFNAPARMLAAGQITKAGDRLDPGDDFSRQAVIEVPLDSGQGRVELSATISFIRADRCKLANSYPQSIEYSWDVESSEKKHLWDAPRWLANPGDDFFRYRSRIYRSSAIMNMTQAPDWAAMWWVIPKWREGRLFAPGDTIPYMQVHISRDPDSQEVLNEDEQEPYGMKTRDTAVDQPVALLRQAAEKP